MGEFLKSFKSRVDYESGKTGTYPSISFIEGDNTVEYEKRSFITATYEIDSNTISKYPDKIPLIKNTKLCGYSIEGEYSEKFTKELRETNLEIVEVTKDADDSIILVMPNEEVFFGSGGVNENYKITLSRELQSTDLMITIIKPKGSTEYVCEQIPVEELELEAMFYIDNGTSLRLTEESIGQLRLSIINDTEDGKAAIFFTTEEDLNNYASGLSLNSTIQFEESSCPIELTYPTPSTEKVIKVTYELDPDETSVGNYDGFPLKTIEFNLLKDKEYHVVDSAFRGTELDQVEFPDQIVKLGKYIFGEGGVGMALINTLSLGDKITNTDEAFVGPYPTFLHMGKGMTNVTSLSLPNACVSIEFSDNTERIEFLGNPNMRGIIIPKSVKYFGGISGEQLKTIVFDGCNPEFPENGFIGDCPQLNSVSLGKNWSQPLHNVLHNNIPMLKSFTIPPLVTEIPEDFCRNSSSGGGFLQTLYIGRGIRNIHYKAFALFGNSLTEVYCFCKKPPYIDGYYEMDGITTTGTLYCPKGTLDEWNSGDHHLGALLKKLGWTIQEIPDGITEENPYGTTEETNEEEQ